MHTRRLAAWLCTKHDEQCFLDLLMLRCKCETTWCSQAACAGGRDPTLLLCLLRLTYGSPALRAADGAVSLAEDLLSDVLGHGDARSDQQGDAPAPDGADSAMAVVAERSPSYTELELTVPGLQPQARLSDSKRHR